MSATGPIARLGARTQAFFTAGAQMLSLLYGALVVIPLYARGKGLRVVWLTTLEQIRFGGSHALPLLSVAALAVGLLIVTQAGTYVPLEYAPGLVATILVRDVIPLVVAVVMIGRSGTAIAVELGSMKLSGEVEALQSMGLTLEHVIVLPRLLAAITASFLLTIYGLAVGGVLGYVSARLLQPIPFGLEVLLNAVHPGDLRLALTKAVLFGAVVALVGVREGLAVEDSQRMLPRAATRAAVRCFTLVLVLNSAMSLA
jgi:phospholipid/cholesterol/gamma-HCH transport system permease protein